MQNPSSWTGLRTGLAAAAVIAFAALATLLWARVGTVHGKQVRLYLAIDGAIGLIHGSDVWLDGQKVGTVDEITIKPPRDAPPRTVVSVSVLQGQLGHFRTDAHAAVEAGGSLLGTPVLFVTSGTASGRALRAGDTLTVPPGPTTVSATIDSTMRRIPMVLSGLGAVSHDVSWMLRQTEAFNELPVVTAQLQQLQRSGTRFTAMMASPALSDSTLMRRVSRALSDADSLRRVVQSSAVAMQRMRRDTSLVTALSSAREELAQLHAIVASREGTLSRLQGDSSIDKKLARALQQLNALMADVQKHPLRYIAF